jgi:hypothetical protein
MDVKVSCKYCGRFFISSNFHFHVFYFLIPVDALKVWLLYPYTVVLRSVKNEYFGSLQIGEGIKHFAQSVCFQNFRECNSDLSLSKNILIPSFSLRIL